MPRRPPPTPLMLAKGPIVRIYFIHSGGWVSGNYTDLVLFFHCTPNTSVRVYTWLNIVADTDSFKISMWPPTDNTYRAYAFTNRSLPVAPLATSYPRYPARR